MSANIPTFLIEYVMYMYIMIMLLDLEWIPACIFYFPD